MRATDANDGSECSNYYSYWPTFNSDSTRFLLMCDGTPKLYGLDPSAFTVTLERTLYAAPSPSGGYLQTEGAIWSASNPNVLYGLDGLRLWAYNVNAQTYSLVADFTGRTSAAYFNQMSVNTAHNVFAFTMENAADEAIGYAVWFSSNNALITGTSIADLDEVQIDKSGAYLVVKSQLEVVPDEEYIDYVEIVTLSTGHVELLEDAEPHFSPGHSDNGNNLVVGEDNYNNQITVRSLSNPTQFQTVIGYGNDWSQAGHISMLANGDAWALLSRHDAGEPAAGPFQQEIFLVATDGSENVRRIAHHHTVYAGQYYNSPRANISRDGRFVAFTSNWAGARRDVFIAKVPNFGGGGGSSSENVVWTNAVNCTASGNSLQKTGGCDGCPDARAWSQQSIAAGAGELEFTATELNTIRVAGLTHNPAASNPDIDFGIQLSGDYAEVREDGVYKADIELTATSTFRIAIQGTQVKYYKNGVLFYTSENTPSYPLAADAILLNASSTISNAILRDLP